MENDWFVAQAAQVLARMSEARAIRVASNARFGPTCAGCMANESGPQDLRDQRCMRMCAQGVCQKQIWLLAQTLSTRLR